MASECACLLCVVVKNWSSKRCWHVSKQLSFLFEVSATINCLCHIRSFRKHPQFLEPLQPELKSTSKAPPPRAIPERTPHFRGITLRSHQQSNFPDITRKPSVTTAEISACDHAASSLPRWRRVRCMHSRWTVTKFLAISNHHATITTVTTNSHMKIMQLRKSRECLICLRAYSLVQIDFLLQEERGTYGLPLRHWAFYQISTKRKQNTHLEFL